MPSAKGWVYIRQKKTLPGQPGFWPEKKKAEAVTTYQATGNMVLTSKLINVPLDTLKRWKKESWWLDITETLQEEETMELDKKLAKTVAKTLEVVNDRLEKGDFHLDSKTGRILRVPVKMRDAHMVSRDMIDRRTLLAPRKKNEHSAVSKLTTEDRLLKLAETFAELALGKKPKEEKVVTEIIDGEYSELPPEMGEQLNAIHEERETQLPSGESLGSQPQGGEEVEG